MTELVKPMSCAEVRDAAAEFALDILDAEERSAVATHLLRCPTCRAEVDAMQVVGERLLDVVPGTEPPLGFDRRVLARVHETPVGTRRVRSFARRRPRVAMAVAAASVAAAAGFASLGWMAGSSSHQPRTVVLSADFRQGGHQIGEVYAYAGQPPWLTMTVDSAAASGRLTCEVVGPNGHVTVLGTFDVVGGSGSWGAPDPSGVKGVSAVRLVDSHGTVVASARF